MNRFRWAPETPKEGQSGGFALVLSLILVVIVSGLCMGFVRLAATTSGAQTGAVDQMRAFYLAEAGLSEAFHAVRMGRTGRIGTASDPASYGDGLVFVESLINAEGYVLLRSEATCGGGSVTLGLVVDPEDPPLGFFADEDLVIEGAMLMDGFDSTERSYAEEIEVLTGQAVPEPEEAEGDRYFVEDVKSPYYEEQVKANDFVETLGSELFLVAIGDQMSVRRNLDGSLTIWTLSNHPIEYWSLLSDAQRTDLQEWCLRLRAADVAGALIPQESKAPSGSVWSTVTAVDDDDDDDDGDDSLSGSEQASGEASSINAAESGGDGSESAPTLAGAVHTQHGALLGSNGDVAFVGADAAQSQIFGSVVPGTTGAVTGLPESAVSGSVESRALPVQLAPVSIPAVGDPVDVLHAGVIPHIVSPGTDSIGSMHVENGSEVIIRGPAKLVVHDLLLDGGSVLTLDTRDGNVELFITGSLDMDPASFVETTGVRSDEVSIQAGVVTAGDPAPELDLDATSVFYGTIYAPDSRVHIGAGFEIFGSVAARRLEIAQGARLHFDDESYNGTLPVPEQESWQILELPESTRRPTRVNLTAAPVGPVPLNPPLATAHILDEVTLSIRYVDQSGVEQRFSGKESTFDWSDVGSIMSQQRSPLIALAQAPSESGVSADGAVALSAGEFAASASAVDGIAASVSVAPALEDQASPLFEAGEPAALIEEAQVHQEDWSTAEATQERRKGLLEKVVDWFKAQDWSDFKR